MSGKRPDLADVRWLHDIGPEVSDDQLEAMLDELNARRAARGFDISAERVRALDELVSEATTRRGIVFSAAAGNQAAVLEAFRYRSSDRRWLEIPLQTIRGAVDEIAGFSLGDRWHLGFDVVDSGSTRRRVEPAALRYDVNHWRWATRFDRRERMAMLVGLAAANNLTRVWRPLAELSRCERRIERRPASTAQREVAPLRCTYFD